MDRDEQSAAAGPRDPSLDQPIERHFSVSDGTCPKRAAGVTEFPLGETEMLLYTEGRQVVHTLNASAWAVWDLSDGTRSVAEIATELGADVGRPASEIIADIRETVQRLGALGLLDAV